MYLKAFSGKFYTFIRDVTLCRLKIFINLHFKFWKTLYLKLIFLSKNRWFFDAPGLHSKEQIIRWNILIEIGSGTLPPRFSLLRLNPKQIALNIGIIRNRRFEITLFSICDQFVKEEPFPHLMPLFLAFNLYFKEIEKRQIPYRLSSISRIESVERIRD